MASDYELRRDEAERSDLERIVFQVETAMAVSTPASRGVFDNLLQNARTRISELDKKIKDSQEERDARSREQFAKAQLAEREARLSAEEKEIFSGFLEKEFFTKKDFGALEQFYRSTWERLSDEGKDAMSQRVWKGVRREEYRFGELPEAVREKEMDWAYSALVKRERSAERAGEIPAKDREEFIRAYEAGQREEAVRVLERESFKENMFRQEREKNGDSRSAVEGREAEKLSMAKRIEEKPSEANISKSEGRQAADIDLSAVNLDGLTLSDAERPGTTAQIPNADAKVQPHARNQF